MTVGSIGANIPPNITYVGQVATRYAKSWSGTDYPPRIVLPPEFFDIHRETRRKDGSSYVKTITVRLPHKSSGPRTRVEDHPYTMTLISDTALGVQLNPYLSNAVWNSNTLVVHPTNGVPSLFTANDDIKLVNKLREKLYGSDFNMSVFLGEGHQSVKLIADSAIRIAKAMHHVKTGDISGAARSLLEGTTRAPLKSRHEWDASRPRQPLYPNLSNDAQNVASHWLELQYGWRPLLKDAYSAGEQLAHHLSIPAQTTYRVGLQEVKSQLSYTWPGSDYRTCGTLGGILYRSHRKWLMARIRESDLPSALEKMGVLDPELVAWELMPYSFVVDWFVPIGSWMEARALSNRLKGIFVTSELKKSEFGGASVFETAGRRGYVLRNSPSLLGAKFCNLAFSRTVSTSLKVPLPTLKPLSKIASWEHCANALALVTKVFKPDYNPAKLPPRSKRDINYTNILPESHWSF